LWYLVRVSLSRRQFFRRFVRPGEKTREEREARYVVMDAYVRTNLLPYDFSLTAEQETELLAAVRAGLEETGDEELFSAIVRFRVDELVDAKIRPWRDMNLVKEHANRLKEIRDSAPDYVNAYLNAQATPSAIERLRQQFQIDDSTALEAELKIRIRDWIATVDDIELLQYDVVTVKDLVFAQLRSWC
jgi:hypothetical protein